MDKKLIIAGVAGLLVVLLLGVGGFFAYMMYSKLSAYQALGSASELGQVTTAYEALQKEHSQTLSKISSIEKEFAVYRKKTLDNLTQRAQRKVDTSVAAFTPISGIYVLAATAAQEQLENCLDAQALINFEAENFSTSDPAVVLQQDKICGTYIEQKLAPLFKYQMLRVRASMSGSLGHLRPEAEEKFKEARKLLELWSVPVNSELEKYIHF